MILGAVDPIKHLAIEIVDSVRSKLDRDTARQLEERIERDFRAELDEVRSYGESED